MTILEILLLVAGGLAFISSFFLPDGKKAQNAEISEEELRARVDEAIENSRARIDDMSEESIRYSMERTERALDKITNEKMMALGEYSDAIMSQIAQNHQETVFLHDMLNRSKDELTELLNRAEKASKDADKRANDAYDLARNAEKLAEEVKGRVDEYSAQAYAAEEKMIDARRMMQEMPVRREELSTQADSLVRAVELKSREESDALEEEAASAEEYPEVYSITEAVAEPAFEEVTEDISEELTDPAEELAEPAAEAPYEEKERSAYEEVSEALALATEEYVSDLQKAESLKEMPAEKEPAVKEAVAEEPAAEALPETVNEIPEEEPKEEALSEEEKMERILQAAAAELASERKRPMPAAKRPQPVRERPAAEAAKAEPVKTSPVKKEAVKGASAKPEGAKTAALKTEAAQPVAEKHSVAAARALLESVSKSSPALGEDFAGGKRPVAGERISRTSVKRKPRNSVKRSAMADMVKGQISTDEYLSQKDAQKEAAPRTREVVTLQFAPGENSANHNERILQMHRMGRSNMAIAKDLGLGIGEVKLVIDLYENMS